jgi:2-alkenal reductase
MDQPMKQKKSLGLLFTMLFLLLVLVACGTDTPASQDAGTAAPTVDTDAIVQSVLNRVESQLTAAADAAPSTVDTDQIKQQLMDEVESILAEETAQTAPVDASAEALVTGLQEVLTSLYQRTNPAVVYIIDPARGSGSGFVYDVEGHIVTNNHVVEAGRNFEVVFSNGERQSAELVGADPDSDLAVIRVDDLPEGVQPLPLASADDFQVGQLVIAIGNPFGEQGSMSLGIISGLDRSLRSQRASIIGGAQFSLPEVIQTDAPINPGNSGGPLLNLDGEVVGVNSAIASTTGTNSGVGYSIPVAAVRQVVPALIEEGEYAYPYMGISVAQEISLSAQEEYGLPQTQGAYVLGVTPGSPADDAGLIAADPNSGRGGDLIVAIDDQQVNDFSDLNSYLVFHTTVGQTIDVTVLRDGETTTLPLTLEARP